MTHFYVPMASLTLQDVTHQLVQQFIAELHDMLPDLVAGVLSQQQQKILRKIVAFFDQEMKEHHLEEERHIFPLLLSQGDTEMCEKVRVLEADHQALRDGWLELKKGIEHALAQSDDAHTRLSADFERYSTRFAKHLVLEESIQFSPDAKLLFQRWDSTVL